MSIKSFDDVLSQTLAAGNQKLGLLAALLRCGTWASARPLVVHLLHSGVQAAAHQHVGNALCALLSHSVQPIHDAVYPLPGPLTPPVFEAVRHVSPAYSSCIAASGANYACKGAHFVSRII